MAAVLDISILNSVSIVIVFLLVFVAGWGILRFVNPFKGSAESYYGLMAFLLAVLLVLSRKAVNVILIATPWLILVMMIAFFIIFFSKMFGIDDKSIAHSFSEKGWGWMVFVLVLIVLFALGNSFGQDLLAATQPGTNVTTTEPIVMEDGTVVYPAPGDVATVSGGDFGTNLTFTLFHPKILGVLFFFVLATLTMILLNQSTSGGGHH
jgi:hypothetical protein